MKRSGEIPVPNVIAARLGHKASIAGLASSDRAVYLFPISNRSVASGVLASHPTAVNALSFNQSDDSLVTGCSGGSVWLWDVVSSKQTLTFSGHRSACSVMEYHPFGNFFVSGSSDTNVKVWDARDGRCVQTYRNHSAGITAVRFSPHGRWLATGDDDGVVRVFDLSSGRPLACLESHTGSVTALDFHPTDFFLLSAALDKSIKLWSCESAFSLAASSEPDLLPATQVKFCPDGSGLYVASAAALKKFDLNAEQKRISCTAIVETKWDNLLDMHVGGGVVGVSASDSVVSLWAEASPHALVVESRNASTELPVRRASRKENSPPPLIDTTSADSVKSDSESSSVKSLLSTRLLVARTVCALWQDGKLKQAIDESIASSDPVVFVSLLAALPNERSRTPMSIDSCSRILQHIVGKGFLNSQILVGQVLSGMPFSSKSVDVTYIVATTLAAVQVLTKRFGPMIAELSRAEEIDSGVDFAKEERISKMKTCKRLFEELADIVAADVKSTRTLKREKEETIQAIKLIQL